MLTYFLVWIALAVSISLYLGSRHHFKEEALRNAYLLAEYMPVLDHEAVVNKLNGDYLQLKSCYEESLQTLKKSETYLTFFDLGVGTTDKKLYMCRIKPERKAVEKAINDLASVESEIKELRSVKLACICEYLGQNIVLGDSKAKANQLFNREIKLRLRCLDTEFSMASAVIDWNNANRVVARCKQYFEELNRSGEHMKTFVQPRYLELKIKALLLGFEIEVTKKDIAEREATERRIEREALREEARLKADIEKAVKERAKLEDIIAKEIGKKSLLSAEDEILLGELRRQLVELKEREKRAISMAQKTRAGFVYVISNQNSFCTKICKIGMTRRLDPYERVKELGDASVPDFFDVHAYAYSEDAPKLEKALHDKFSEHRVNLVNRRKEFFFVDPEEVVKHLKSTGKGIELQVF